MFAKPRAKKLATAPPKKRKAAHAIDEIAFDGSSRAEYLTGFHKRKLLRIKHAQEIAAEKERQERIEFRKQVREERRQRLEEHVQKVKDILRETGIPGLADEGSGSGSGSDGEWGGIQDDDDAPPPLEPVDHEEEYIDEDRYTTVTVESVAIDRDGMHKPRPEPEDEAGGGGGGGREARAAAAAEPRDKDDKSSTEKERPPKKKKKKFRYESKAERQVTERKNRAANRFKGQR